MSNLWFFRLKRAEQQRRRSSGEQSVGSSSLQSASGCCNPNSSNASLQHHHQQQNFAARPHEVEAELEIEAEQVEQFKFEFQSQQSVRQASSHGLLARLESGSETSSSQVQDRARHNQLKCQQQNTASGAPIEQFVACHQPEAVSLSGGQEVRPGKCMNMNINAHQAARTGALSVTSNSFKTQQNHHAPVTIIRSDSTTTSFIAMGRPQVVKRADEEQEEGRSEFEKKRAAGNLGAQEGPKKSRQMICELAKVAGPNQVSTRIHQDDNLWRPLMPLTTTTCATPTKAFNGTPEVELAAVEAETMAGGMTKLNRSQRSRFVIHDHLSSGKVPPIQRNERRLLSPNGSPRPSRGSCASASNFQISDSMDNLAALIPRIRVEFYNSENTLKEKLQLYFIKDHTVSLYLRTGKLILKILACYLYVWRVILDRGPSYANCYGCQGSNQAQSNNATGANSIAMVQQQQLAATSSKFDSHPYDGPINFRALFWVDRGPNIWALQTSIGAICFVEALLMQYLTYKNNIFSIISFHFTLEIITNLPFILSIFWLELRTLFVPGFLNCWLAKQCLEAMLNDISIVRQTSVFSHRLTILSATVFCLIFTSACGFQHTQRSGGRNFISIFESIYFVVVTFSTVGYGDFKPETWPSQLFIMVMICVALIVLPTQFEQLAYFWIERKKLGASYAHHSTSHEKHVVVCSTTLRADTIMDFLNEFYAHPLLQTFSVVLLSPCELDTTMKLVLQTPTWNNRVVYIQGSALKANDLIRARMQSAEACFILAARNYNDRSAADEHTILRSWAIRDFSPYVPQYVQIFRTENKIHVAFAEHVVCDDEFKYALLANNCLIPGTSTLVTLLLHTSQQQHQSQSSRRRRRRRGAPRRAARQVQACCRNLLDGFKSALGRPFRSSNATNCNDDWRSKINEAGGLKEEADITFSGPEAPLNSSADQEKNRNQRRAVDKEAAESDEDDDDDDDCKAPEWKRLYGKCSANEIYHIRLSDSRFFGEYQGKSFTYASFHSHRKFGVALVGVQTDMRGTWPIMLNPGPTYVLKPSDILFYINITKEENSALMPMIMQTASAFASNTSAPPTAAAAAADEVGAANASSTLEPQQHVQQSTYIRIEASSPTLGLPSGGTADNTTDELLQQQAAPRVPKKHSVADGASIVARSLCSVAGLAGAKLDQLIPSAIDSEALGTPSGQQRSSICCGNPIEMAAGRLIEKRNSSASTSGLGGGGQQREVVMAGGAGGLLGAASGYISRNTSTLELAAIATGLRKGSNISITSTKSRDASPTRLKQVVSGLAVKMKRVKLGKSLTHLTIPRMDLGGGSSSACSTESFVNARGRRPSIAPVPAMMGESEEHDSDHEREQESYFSMSWQSSSESSPIVKKFVFCTTYVGVSPTLCYLLQRKKLACCLQLAQACEHCPFKNARQYNWPNRCIILASDFASNGIYNFLVPLRAHFHNPNELRPIVLLLERKPSPQFIDAISWFPMVYWMPGSIDNLDDLIKAGINLAHSVVVTNKESTNSAEEDYLADCNTIVAVQTMFKMFPQVGIITELSQSSNMRFMQFRAHDLLLGGLTLANYHQHNQQRVQQQDQLQQQQTQLEGGANLESSCERQSQTSTSNAIRDRIRLRKLHSEYFNKTNNKDINSHAYKYRLPFAAGNVFSASMLDTLLYQAFVKDYMITMVRLLLGIDQAPGSGFLASMSITKEDLWIRTYGRLYQRLCSTTCEIPLGIYRTEPLERNSAAYSVMKSSNSNFNQHERSSITFGAFVSQQASYEQATEELERIEISNMVKNRLQDLDMNVNDYDDSMTNRNNTFSYVIINPNCDVPLREGDIIYLIRPSPIHSRKLFMHRANSVRYVDQSQQQTNPGAPHFHQHRANEQNNKNLGSCCRDARASSLQQECSSTNPIKPASTTAYDDDRPFQQQASSDQTSNLKSYFSDGDFSEVLIKINDHEDQPASSGQQPPIIAGDFDNQQIGAELKRRRSSCSDANDSKRSSLSHE